MGLLLALLLGLLLRLLLRLLHPNPSKILLIGVLQLLLVLLLVLLLRLLHPNPCSANRGSSTAASAAASTDGSDDGALSTAETRATSPGGVGFAAGLRIGFSFTGSPKIRPEGGAFAGFWRLAVGFAILDLLTSHISPPGFISIMTSS